MGVIKDVVQSIEGISNKRAVPGKTVLLKVLKAMQKRHGHRDQDLQRTADA